MSTSWNPRELCGDVIRCAVITLLAAAAVMAPTSARGPGPVDPPSVLYGELFAAVQASAVFSDSKQFADAIARGPPSEIVDAWKAQRAMPGFSLRDFVLAHFELEPVIAPPVPAAHWSLCERIAALWPVLTRRLTAPTAGSSLLPLPFPAIVPGGRFHEAYYWDTYFSLLGLAPEGQNRTVPQDMLRTPRYAMTATATMVRSIVLWISRSNFDLHSCSSCSSTSSENLMKDSMRIPATTLNRHSIRPAADGATAVWQPPTIGS